MIRITAPFLLILGLAASPQEPDSLAHDQVNGPPGAQLDFQLTRFGDYGFSGTVLVVRDGQVLLVKGYGLADAERGVRNTAETRFEMNSMTKMFTGAAILQLAAQGRLRLSDPVAHYLHGFPPAKERATIEQLATHTAGLISAGADLAGDSRDAFVRDVAAAPLESEPGARYRYSNAGFSLLAVLIEIVSGESYEEYLRRHVFEPAEMLTARFRTGVPSNDPRFAHGYVGTPAALEPGPPNPYVWGTKGAGGVWTTVGDMYRWVLALEKGRVVPEAQRRVLLSPPPAPAEEVFGWHVSTVDGRQRIDKGGGSDDFASQLLYWPRERVVIVWASNNTRQRWRRTMNQVLPAVVFGDNAAPLPRVVPNGQSMVDARRHSYVAERDTLDLRAGPGYLYAAANQLGIPTNVMFFPQDPDHFTAFDPATGFLTRLEFTDSDRPFATVVLPDGKQIRARR